MFGRLLQRLGYLVGLAALFPVIVGCGTSPPTAAQSPTGPDASRRLPSPQAVGLIRPGAMAVSPTGTLYLADDGRNQILKRLPSGRLVVVAGTGVAGFSGDGNAATRAEINDPGGMAFGPHGTLYFADTGNNRVRAISPAGTITTVAGNGRTGTVQNKMAALNAPLSHPAAVAVSPRGRVYLATSANQIVRISASGQLRVVVGGPAARPYGGIYGVGRPAVNASPDNPDGLAFDAAGNLYIAGFATKTLLKVTPNGTLTLPIGHTGFYPRGNGGLVPAPDGSVVAINSQSIVRLGQRGLQTLADFSRRQLPDGIKNFLPNGVAVGPHGTIYADTFYGNGFVNETALIALPRHGAVRVLWHGKDAIR